MEYKKWYGGFVFFFLYIDIPQLVEYKIKLEKQYTRFERERERERERRPSHNLTFYLVFCLLNK